MRIAYSCAGEGYGHAARMVALHEDLSRHHDYLLFVPDTVASFVRDRLPRAVLRSIPCFELSKAGNRIRYGATALSGLAAAARFVPELRRLAGVLKRERIDVVLSDFEPYLPWAARIAGIPVVQMNHPGIVRRYVGLDPRSWIAAAAASLMEGPWDRRILVSFFGGDVGPVLRPSLLSKPAGNEGFIAVNLKQDARSRVLPLLDAQTGLHYKLYPAPGADFDEGLRNCRAVITNGGHQTLSEALALGKPVLALPQEGQYEQELNARMLERTGRGMRGTLRNLPRTLPKFLSSLDALADRKVLPAAFRLRDSRAALLDALNGAFAAYAAGAAPESAAAKVGLPWLLGRETGEAV